MNGECLCGFDCRRGEVFAAIAKFDEDYRRRLNEILNTDLWSTTGPGRMVSL